MKSCPTIRSEMKNDSNFSILSKTAGNDFESILGHEKRVVNRGRLCNPPQAGYNVPIEDFFAIFQSIEICTQFWNVSIYQMKGP